MEMGRGEGKINAEFAEEEKMRTWRGWRPFDEGSCTSKNLDDGNAHRRSAEEYKLTILITGVRAHRPCEVANDPTDATFVVGPGKYTVAVSGGQGNLNCAPKEFAIAAAQVKTVTCSSSGWSE
jgi:hypothetical protein